MGEVSDYYIDQQMFGRPRASDFPPQRNKPYQQDLFNEWIRGENYNKLVNFLTGTLDANKRLTKDTAKRFIYDNLVKKGKVPYHRVSLLNAQELISLINIIDKCGCELNDDEQIKVNKILKGLGKFVPNEEEKKMYERALEKGRGFSHKASDVPTAEVENLFRVETMDVEEGEFSLVLERGMYREIVAVSYAYPHYRSQGFYTGRKSSVFSKDLDSDKMVIDMRGVFQSLALLLNNLASADKLTEDTYNSALDGYETFLYEALDFSEIESLIGKTSGLKDGKKKRIKARGTKGSKLNKE